MSLRSERRYIKLDDVKPGMMVEFFYKKVSGDSSNYIVLVVDPNRTNDRATQPQLHGFVIDKLSDRELVEFFMSFRKTTKFDYDDRRASVVEELNTDEAYATFASSKYVTDRKYRTFNRTGISQLRQILLGSVE